MIDLRVVAFALIFFAGNACAQIYRWVDANGRVNFSNATPPAGVQATVVDPNAKEGRPSAESTECYTIRCQGERMEERQRRRDADEAKSAAERAATAPRPPRGLDFRNYVRIQRGMTEGELLGIAGEPDFMSDQGLAIDAPTTVQVNRNTRVSASGAQRMVTWTYMPTSGDPFTTTITLIGGRVSELDRQRKF